MAPFFEPIPDFVGLTCIQQGDIPDPVLCHEDVIVQPNEEISVSIKSPERTPNVALRIVCVNLDGAVECRFNSANNTPVPIDSRDFVHVLPWFSCCNIFLKNPMETQAHISISAVEVVN